MHEGIDASSQKGTAFFLLVFLVVSRHAIAQRRQRLLLSGALGVYFKAFKRLRASTAISSGLLTSSEVTKVLARA